jgi:hypothetical protein
MRKKFELTLDELVENCIYIPNQTKSIFINQLQASIDLYKNKTTHDIDLAEKYVISMEIDREQAKALCDKLNDGIKAAEKLKTIIINIDRGNSVLINSLNKFIDNAKRNLEVEKPEPRSRGGQVKQEMHALALSFKSVWEHCSEVKKIDCEAIKLAVAFLVEAGVYSKPNSALEHNEIRKNVSNLFENQLSGNSKIIPYLQIEKNNN